MRSHIPIMLTMEVSLMRAISPLPMAGMTFLTAWEGRFLHSSTVRESKSETSFGLTDIYRENASTDVFRDIGAGVDTEG